MVLVQWEQAHSARQNSLVSPAGASPSGMPHVSAATTW